MIELINANKIYGRIATGLFNESFNIPSGQIVGILGENGAGKSTLLRVIAGLTTLDSGSVTIDSRHPFQMAEKIAFITEEGSYFPFMTILEYAEFLKQFYPLFNMDKYMNLLSFFGMYYSRNKKIKHLSRGEKAKIELCAGFSKGASYLLMDEPFLGEDVFSRRDFLKLIISTLKEDETIILTTHLIDEVENILDRAIIMSLGKVVADVYVDKLKEEGSSLLELMMGTFSYSEDKYFNFK